MDELFSADDLARMSPAEKLEALRLKVQQGDQALNRQLLSFGSLTTHTDAETSKTAIEAVSTLARTLNISERGNNGSRMQ